VIDRFIVSYVSAYTPKMVHPGQNCKRNASYSGIQH